MAVINQVGNALTGSTGTGAFVGANTPTITTPGIVGVTDASNATAGNVGEFVTSQVLSSAPITPATSTAANVTSISLSAGDWQLWGNVHCLFSSGNGVSVFGWISTTSATAPDLSLRSGGSLTAGGLETLTPSVPSVRLSLAGTTTVYLSAVAAFAAGSVGISGGIFARRMR